MLLKLKKFLLICTLLSAHTAFATPKTAFDLNALKQGETLLQLGGFWINQGRAQHINIQSLVGSQYTLDSKQQSNGLVGLGYFIHGLDSTHYQLAYGLNIFYLAPTTINGYIRQEQLYQNLSYNYTIQHLPLYLAAKTNIETKLNNYQFTLDAGIGPNFMRLHDYQETPLNSTTIASNTFSAHNSTEFSVTAGIGIRAIEAPLECGYRFFYLGAGQLTRNNNLLNNSLKTGSAFANAIVCSVML